MKRYILIPALLLLSMVIQAQKDPEARRILDRVSEKARSDEPLGVDFEYVYEDLMNQETSSESGNLLLKDNQFRLEIGQSTVCSDGTTTWNHLTEANEVYISDADESGAGDEFFINNPSDLFNFYKEGFKYRLKGELKVMGKDLYEIDIYPEDLEKNYHTVKLLIGKKNLQIVSAQAFGKGGANHTVILTNYRRKAKTETDSFVFDPEKHPGIEVVDTRF